ncbi:class II aldolase/adducin family protein [Roseibium sp.]|uniref:class II aldolase/adducin family protein n=1 Tax=Roseibium sp. TaxID=1936156 RepID=UPI003BAAD322
MKKAELALREDIIARCREMNSSGINQGTSGNISVRYEDRMLISPSATPYDQMTPDMIASVGLEDTSGRYEGPLKPSTEWRFHQKLLRGRPDAGAVVHAHPTYCTTLAIARKEIPSCHYMIAAFGGNNVRCAGYATFGSEELSELAIDAMTDRTACLLANHGMIAIGENLAKAMWRAIELETIAKQYYLSLSIGGSVLLSDAAIDDTHRGFAGYGLQDDAGKETPKPKRRAAKKPAAKTAAAKKPAAKAASAKKPAAKAEAAAEPAAKPAAARKPAAKAAAARKPAAKAAATRKPPARKK